MSDKLLEAMAKAACSKSDQALIDEINGCCECALKDTTQCTWEEYLPAMKAALTAHAEFHKGKVLVDRERVIQAAKLLEEARSIYKESSVMGMTWEPLRDRVVGDLQAIIQASERGEGE